MTATPTRPTHPPTDARDALRAATLELQTWRIVAVLRQSAQNLDTAAARVRTLAKAFR
jgi:hypothetical protein